MPITAWVISLLALVLAPILLIRFRKRWVAAFNLAVTNRITSRFAARLPGFGILTHVGRKSGKVYRTPVNVFRAPEGFLIALTYGRESEWVRNVVTASASPRFPTRSRDRAFLESLRLSQFYSPFLRLLGALLSPPRAECLPTIRLGTGTAQLCSLPTHFKCL